MPCINLAFKGRAGNGGGKMVKIWFMMPLIVLSSACDATSAPQESPAFAVNEAGAPEDAVDAKADENWECTTGSPDAAYERLVLTDLQSADGRIKGRYQLTGFEAFDANGTKGQGAKFAEEAGTVTIERDVYRFTVKTQTCDGCAGSLLLSGAFRKGTDEEGRPVLNELLSKDREALFSDENFDGFAQACGPAGSVLGNFQ